MKALRFHHPKKVSVDEVDDPKIEKDDDIILKVTSTAICGSDLHILNGMVPQARNHVLGHEFMGEVVEVGKSVKKFNKGDRVVVPFPIACGSCFFCNHKLPTQCENSNEKNYGPEGGLIKEKGGALFGYTDLYGGYSGGQAQYVRVPYANYGPRAVPDELTDDDVLFLTDIFPTGWSAVDWSNLKGGETVAVFGAGPVGIMAMKSAWLQGAGRVIGIDIQNYRLDQAIKSANVETINAKDENPVEVIRSLTEGRGADVCIDAVGMEADHGILAKAANVIQFERGSLNALNSCLSAVRRGGTVSVVGVYGSNYNNFHFGQIFDKELSLKTGQATVHNYIDHLMDLVKNKKVKLDDIITHRLPLREAPKGYEIFNKKQDNCLKVVLDQWAA
ncbi:MAG: glutathione-dependent formaldehyde dehydrogenase [Halobacteriovoraceae bacterium]|nr:glutathione-dependent formaldehyde dehydrogenase [Halobacteriovoraceae bacterium]